MVMWFNNLKIQSKLIGGFAMILFISTVALGWGIYSMRLMDEET